MAYGELSKSGIAGTDGIITVSFSPGARTRRWTVGQVSVQVTNAPAGSTCTLTKGSMFVSALIPTGDVAGAGPPIDLIGTESMTVTWTGLTQGMSGTVFVIYDDGR
jgi:hypothetical protein